jgi:hypothetical protein
VVPAATQIYKRCYFNAVGSISAFEACGYSSGEIAQVHAGDRVQILSDVIRAAGGDEIVEVKLQQWVGWMPVAELSRSAP